MIAAAARGVAWKLAFASLHLKGLERSWTALSCPPGRMTGVEQTSVTDTVSWGSFNMLSTEHSVQSPKPRGRIKRIRNNMQILPSRGFLGNRKGNKWLKMRRRVKCHKSREIGAEAGHREAGFPQETSWRRWQFRWARFAEHVALGRKKQPGLTLEGENTRAGRRIETLVCL